MITIDLNPKQALQMLKVIFFSLIAGLVTFLVIVLYIADNKFIFNLNLSDPLTLSSIVLTCIALPTGYLYTKMVFNKIDQNEVLKTKLPKYQSGQVIRLVTCEGVGMLAIASILLTSNLFFLIFLLIALIIMIRYYPTSDKIGMEINLTQNEIARFNE